MNCVEYLATYLYSLVDRGFGVDVVLGKMCICYEQKTVKKKGRRRGEEEYMREEEKCVTSFLSTVGHCVPFTTHHTVIDSVTFVEKSR
jgi:hypothetical protein